MKSLLSLVLLVTALVLAPACTKKTDAPATDAAAPAAETAAATATAPTGEATATIEISSDGDNIAFNKTELKCKAGETVKLVFKNTSVSSNMQHNWVLVQPGKESEIEQAGISAGAENGWAPASHPAILAQTGLLDPGKTKEITFVCPAKGSYPYICTFPGHAQVMKGVLKAE